MLERRESEIQIVLPEVGLGAFVPEMVSPLLPSKSPCLYFYGWSNRRGESPGLGPSQSAEDEEGLRRVFCVPLPRATGLSG